MTADYAAIRKENLRLYGESTRLFELLGELYADRTHFIFELLQNAEDQGARSVKFILHPDRLEFEHDGELFTSDDVKHICSVEKSSKEGNLNKIGKFGIGFKSVYAYTSLPQIYSGSESFEIRTFVHPHECKPRSIFPNKTLFVFPFNHERVSAAQAHAEIRSKLVTLDARTLLFLKSIHAIHWEIKGDRSGLRLRKESALGTGRRVELYVEGQRLIEEWLVYRRQVAVPESDVLSVVEIAFSIRELNRQDIIEPIAKSPLVVFFPTQKETDLGFLIQGSFRTTPARDNIPADDKWNAYLVNELAHLLGDALVNMRDEGLLSISTLSTLPLSPKRFEIGSMFRPLFDSVKTTLDTKELLPTGKGRFTSAKHAVLADSAAVREVINETQLAALFSFPSAQWLTTDITENRTHNLWIYLRDQLKVPVVTAETLLSKISADFMEDQDDSWVEKLYIFLDGFKGAPTWARYKPIVRLADDSHVAPLNRDGTANAFLPGGETTGLPTVKQSVIENERAQDFLRHVGLKAPDIYSEVMEKIIPFYQNELKGIIRKATQTRSLANLSEEQHKVNVDKIFAALASAAHDKRRILIGHLRQTTFLQTSQLTEQDSNPLKAPVGLYLPSIELVQYFGGTANAPFASDIRPDYLTRFMPELLALGLENKPKLLPCSKLNLTTDELRDITGSKAQIAIKSFKDHELDGLHSFLTDISQLSTDDAQKRSIALWTLLILMIDGSGAGSIPGSLGEIEWTEDKFRRRNIDAQWIRQLRKSSWIPCTDGLKRPTEISTAQLPPGFRSDKRIAALLKMIDMEVIGELCTKAGIKPKILQFILRNLDNQDNLEAMMSRWEDDERRRTMPPELIPSRDPESDIEEEQESRKSKTMASLHGQVKKFFDKPAEGDEEEDYADSGTLRDLADPEKRRSSERKRLDEAFWEEPSADTRFRIVPRKQWEAKEPEVREFFRNEYNGRCQICDFTFRRRSGGYYFEAVYMVSRTYANWTDHPGSVLCVCPNCCAQMLYGAVEQAEIIDIILSTDIISGQAEYKIPIKLCAKDRTIRFSARHLIGFQEILKTPVAEQS